MAIKFKVIERGQPGCLIREITRNSNISLKNSHMNLKSVLFVISVLLFTTHLWAEDFYDGKITLLNGQVKTGWVTIPKSSTDKKIWFKLSQEAGREAIESEQISNVTVNPGDGIAYTFDNVNCLYNDKVANKLMGGKRFLLIIQRGYYWLYITSDNYKVNKEGHVCAIDHFVATRDLPSFYYFIRRPDDENAHFFAITSPSNNLLGLHKYLKKSAAMYLSDDEELVNKINNKELNHRDVERIIQMYNKFKEQGNTSNI